MLHIFRNLFHKLGIGGENSVEENVALSIFSITEMLFDNSPVLGFHLLPQSQLFSKLCLVRGQPRTGTSANLGRRADARQENPRCAGEAMMLFYDTLDFLERASFFQI
jgi:hypothetical protein